MEDDMLMDSDQESDGSSRALKRLKKSGTSDGNDSDNGGRDTDRSNTNSERSRREHEEEVGSSRSSSGRRSGEVGYANAEHGAHSKSGSRHGTSANYNSKGNSSSSSRRREWDSKGSSSRSRSSSPVTLFDRLKANWGRESWQDFELLRNNVPGPGIKGYAGPGASQGASGKSEMDQEFEEHECNCMPVGGDPGAPTCYDDQCHNYATMQECRKDRCHPGCRNQRIQKRENAKVEVFEAAGKGMGLKLLEPVSKGQFIAEYVGEIITRKELNKRMISSAGTRKLYMMQLGDNTYLDAKRKGGIARFVNHSCDPTCRLEQWTAKGQPRCAVFSLRGMEAGEELSFDYQWEAHHLRENTKCLCGTPQCRGTIEVINPNADPNAESGGGPFARGRAPASAMGVWRTPKDEEYANPEELIGRKVRVYFDGDCTYFEAQVKRYKAETKTHMLLYAGEGEQELDELEEDLIGVQGKIQGIDKWQIWEQSDRVLKIKKKDQASDMPGFGSQGPNSSRMNGNGQHAVGDTHQPSGGRHFSSRFGTAPPQMPPMGMGMGMGQGSGSFSGMMGGVSRAPPPPPPPPPPPQPPAQPHGPRVAEELMVPLKDAPQLYAGSDLQQRAMRQTGVQLVELVDAEDQRACQCPAGQRILRVAGGRDQVNSAVDMLCSEILSLRSFEEWLSGERRRRAQEVAESKELDEDALAQVGRPRQRWCIGSDWHCFSKEVVAQIAANKVVADLRRNALHVVRQVAESGSGTASNSAPLTCHAGILLHRYLAVITVSSSSEAASSTSNTTNSSGANGSHGSSAIKGGKGGRDSAHTNGINSAANGASNATTVSVSGETTGRARMETNFYVLATACLLLANKSLRARVSSARPRRREELLRAAYGVQFRGRAVEKGTAEVLKWEGKLIAAELEIMVALGFDVHLSDPFDGLDQQRKQQAITAECHEKATSLMLESVTQGCSAWLQFEPEVLAMSVLLLAIGTTSSRSDLLNRAQQFLVNVGRMWPAVLACTQRLARSLPSLGGEDEAGPDGVAATLRQLPTLDPSQYPDYEPPMMAAKQRLIQRRRAEDAVAEAQLWTTDLLMMRKAQDRAGLHGGLGGLQGMKGLAGFGANLASNKFVRAAIREENLEAAGLGCLVPSLEVWKGSTVAGSLPAIDGGRTMEVYLQRWPADKKEIDMASGFSSSAVAELALFQEMHATAVSPCGHSTLLVPFAVVKGTGLKPAAKLGAPGSTKTSSDRNTSSKADKAADVAPMGPDDRVAGIMGMDPLGIAGMPMTLGSQPEPMEDMGPGAGGASEGDGDKASPSKIPEELLKPSYLLLEPVRYTLAEILRLCRRPMVLPGPLVKCMLQDLLGAVTICHDRNIVIKSLDAEKVYLNAAGSLKLGCLAQAMMVAPKDTAATPGNGMGGMDGDVDGEIDMEIEDTPAGRKAAHREGKLRMKQEKLQRENICKKAVAAMMKDGEPAKPVLWAMAPEVMVDQKHPHGPATDIWAVGCLAAQLALGKPIFGGRTRKQQLEYIFKCCGSPGQGRWPEGNKAPLYRHLRPVDKEGKSLHFKPRLDKVLAAEGHKGVPLDPDLAELLQGLLKLDSRHRLSARGALASAYFAPRPGLREETVDAWNNLRGDLDKVQMGVATPDQLRGQVAAANAPTGPPPPPPPPPRGLSDAVAQPSPPTAAAPGHPGEDGRGTGESRSGRGERTDRVGRRSHGDMPRDSRRSRGRDGASSPSPPPPPAREGLNLSIQLPIKSAPPAEYDAPKEGRSSRGGRTGRDWVKNRSPSPRGGGGRRRSPANGKRDHRERGRGGERERDRKGRKRGRERDGGVTRSRERDPRWESR
eukprot:g3725.t1